MKKGVKPPTASAEITVGKTTYKTKVLFFECTILPLIVGMTRPKMKWIQMSNALFMGLEVEIIVKMSMCGV